MIRLLAGIFTVVLFIVPVLVLPARPVALVGGAGILLSAVAIAARWRPAATAAAGVFVAEYALALGLGRPPIGVPGAAAFGLALVLLIQTVDLACRARGASVHAGVVRSHIRRSIALAGGALGAVVLAIALAHVLASAVPAAVAPLLASAGALGAIATVARMVARAHTAL